jgi:hypothetical protein
MPIDDDSIHYHCAVGQERSAYIWFYLHWSTFGTDGLLIFIIVYYRHIACNTQQFNVPGIMTWFRPGFILVGLEQVTIATEPKYGSLGLRMCETCQQRGFALLEDAVPFTHEGSIICRLISTGLRQAVTSTELKSVSLGLRRFETCWWKGSVGQVWNLPPTRFFPIRTRFEDSLIWMVSLEFRVDWS